MNENSIAPVPGSSEKTSLAAALPSWLPAMIESSTVTSGVVPQICRPAPSKPVLDSPVPVIVLPVIVVPTIVVISPPSM